MGFLPSTEHGSKHTPFAKLLYKDYADLGVTQLNYTPEGTGDIRTKWTAPRWDAESKKVVYDWLPPEEWIHGTPEYKYDQRIDPFPDAGLHDKPQGLPGPPDPNKFGFFELFRRIARNPVVKVGVKALPFLVITLPFLVITLPEPASTPRHFRTKSNTPIKPLQERQE